MSIRLMMSEKEIVEGRRARIPEEIIGKMVQGYELNEKEKDVVKSRGKVYVLGYVKDGGMTKVQPQLRDLPGSEKYMSESVRIPKLIVEEREKIEEELEEQYMGYYDDEIEGNVLEATDELRDLGIFEDRDVKMFSENSDMITVMINYLKEKEEED